MGWLRDFMNSVDPAIQSFGKLADLCLEHQAWPADLQPKARSLSTLFSKLDRGKDLDWLRDRIAVQQVLGVLLSRPLADLRTALGELPSEGDGRFLKLTDVRFAREIDLSKEELPPGIPHAAFTPPEWSPSWWIAPSGSGRSLVGAWLKARGLASFARIGARDDLERVPSRGAVFLEVETHLSSSELSLTARDLELLRARKRPLCFSASFAPPLPNFACLEGDPPAQYLPELIDWVDELLDETGHFQPDRAENWLRKVALPSGAIRTLGDALGLLGMVDEVMPRTLLAKSLDEVATHFVKRRVREACEQTNASSHLAEVAYSTLQECAARVLVSGKDDLLQGHAIDEWTALLSSPERAESPDPQWFTEALRGALGSQISRRDLRRAARKLPPSAFQLSKSLEAAGLLVGDVAASPRTEGGAERRLHPAWLVSLLMARATQEALRLSPTQWGRILLGSPRASDVITALVDRAKQDDFGASFAVIDDYENARPELVAALEGAVIAAGISDLDGIEVPDELCEGLLSATAEDLLVIDKLPEPRLTLLSGGQFDRDHFLCALAALCRHSRFPLTHFDPIRSDSIAVRFHFAASCRRVLSRSKPRSARAAGILGLLDALFPEDTPERSPALRLIDSVNQADAQLLSDACAEASLETILHFVATTERSEAIFTRGLWRLLADHPDPSSLLESSDGRRQLWREAPARVLASRASQKLPIEWSLILPHQYAEWFAWEAAPKLPAEGAEFCPIDAALRSIEMKGTASLSTEALSLFLARGAARFAHVVARLISDNDEEELSRLFSSCPREATLTLVRHLPPVSTIFEAKSGTVHAVRKFLLRACHERHPGFEDCYNRLLELEAGVGPLRNLP